MRCVKKIRIVNDICFAQVWTMEHDVAIVRRYITMIPIDNNVVSRSLPIIVLNMIVDFDTGGDYYASCHSTIDCQANLICNKMTIPSLCSCQTNYRYYPLVHKCRGDPGAICEQATAECADNAECRDGVCECAFQFVPDKNKKCG
jgi:hypothetical protein